MQHNQEKVMEVDKSSSSVSVENKSAEILDLLSEGVDETSSEKDEEVIKDTEKEEEKTKEEDEIEIKEEDDEEKEELELIEEEEINTDIIVPVRKKEILAKYPKIFKEFPALESAYYKAQQYSEILPTIDDAKEAVEKAQTLDNFEKDIFSGNLETLLSTVNKNDSKVFKKIADNLLQTISKIDNNTGLHIIGNVLKHSLVSAASEGKRNKNENLEAAAKIINEFIFGSEEITNPTKLVSEDKEDEGIKKEREEFEQEKFNTASDSLKTRVNNTIKSTIDANIDPKDSMSSYVKKNAIRDALEQVESALNKDSSFKKIMNNLWKSAKEAKYSSSSLDRIKAAHLSKAKILLPSIIRNARNEALKGIGKVENGSKDRKGPIPANRSSSTSLNTRGNVKEIPKNMTTKDFIMSD